MNHTYTVQAELDRGAALAAKRHAKALWWDMDGSAHIVTLKQGFAFYDNVPAGQHGDACHVQGFDNVKEALRAIRAALPCHCERCTGASE